MGDPALGPPRRLEASAPGLCPTPMRHAVRRGVGGAGTSTTWCLRGGLPPLRGKRLRRPLPAKPLAAVGTSACAACSAVHAQVSSAGAAERGLPAALDAAVAPGGDGACSWVASRRSRGRLQPASCRQRLRREPRTRCAAAGLCPGLRPPGASRWRRACRAARACRGGRARQGLQAAAWRAAWLLHPGLGRPGLARLVDPGLRRPGQAAR
mmetsp:Transcript_117864/g.380392  ORF Transcript_117864/g.380392 Transcript_117864/m.380392 type:complete len:210 (-) Transcript_117864:311-940(-)